MNLSATLSTLRVLVRLSLLPAAAAAATAAPVAQAPAATTPTATTPTATAPAAAVPDSAKARAAAEPGKDSIWVRKYKVGNRPFNRQELREYQSLLQFRPVGKVDSSALLLIYRDARGASLSFEGATSEWAYADDSLPVLAPEEYVPDSLIRARTDGHLRAFLRDKAAQYAFVNFEVTQMQERDLASKEGVKPAVPAYYIGRYLRRLNGRHILGDRFQVRIGVGRRNGIQFISYRDPALTDSSQQERIPTREKVEEYLAKWAREPARLGTRYYPYHPDKLRIRKLKPVRVFESYVLVQEKFRDAPARSGLYLAPRVTVLAEADLVRSTKANKQPHPQLPVLLHFHFPCTPAAGLCWPDGKQGLEDGPRPPVVGQPAPQTPTGAGTPAVSPKTGTVPAPAAPSKP